MSTEVDILLRTQLADRREKLQAALGQAPETEYITDLLAEVDAALERIDQGSYGLCEACHDPIETERLCADPLLRFCLDHLSAPQQRALEQDLELAGRIQRGLLPKLGLQNSGWQMSYRYEAAGPVSGDYCDLLNGPDGNFYFLIGDVSGKGVAASLLMTHLHAIFRILISTGPPLHSLLEQASRVFCESTLPTQYTTLVCGLASPSGRIEISNAGHPPPLLVRGNTVEKIDGNGLPLGLFSNQQFSSHNVHLDRGDSLVLYTDGISEASDPSGDEYGIERLEAQTREFRELTPEALVQKLVTDVRNFRADLPPADDAAVMVIHRSHSF